MPLMRKLLVLIVCLTCFSAIAPAQTITTLAGNGASGFSGDGAAATLAKVNTPFGVVADAAGNCYFTDYNNNRIRKVDGTTGVISTIAGTGSAYFGGDGGQATSAGIQLPRGIAMDPSGNIIFTDWGNNRVRKIDMSTGIITTLAGSASPGFGGDGGPSTAAQLYTPWGVACDPSGNIYIADQGNNRIRKITTSGVISTVAGSAYGFSGDGGQATAARLNYPTGVAAVGANIYIADYGNNIIRKVNASGIISTIGSTHGVPYGYTGDGGPATAAKLYYPEGIACDGSGNIFIADRNNNVIRKIDASGIITTVAGNGYGAGSTTGGYSGDGGPATAAELNQNTGVFMESTTNKLYITDNNNNRVRVVSYIHNPRFVAGDTQGLYICHDAGAVFVNSALAVDDIDVGQTETWNVILAPSHGTLVAAFTTTSTGSTMVPTGLTYSPAAGYSGADIFRVTVYDGTYYDTTTVKVSVIGAPNAGAIVGTDSVCPGHAVALSDTILGGSWSSMNSGIATVSGTGIVTGVSPGIDTILYKVAGCDTGIARFTIKVRIYASCPNSVAGQQSIREGISLSLNPNNGTFNVTVFDASNEEVALVMTNMKGQTVKEFTVPANKSVEVLSGQPAGTYYLTAKNKLKSWTAQVVITE